ncbi:MAG: MBL fold metallo-hydrolase [Bacteroidota bacterium]
MVVSKKFKYEEVLVLKHGYGFVGSPKLFAHLFFVDGLLIDTGQFKARNNIVSDTNDLKIDQIFITHHHEDHTGNIIPIKEKHRCKVLGSEACMQLMKAPPKLSMVQKLIWGNREPYHDIIPVGHVITTPKHSFDVIPVPGHAPDMVALYEPKKQWLFAADLFINTYIGYFLDTESIAEQIASIKHILPLDFKVMFCSHNPQLKNAKQQLAKKLDFLESTFDNVSALHQKGHTAIQIFKELKLKENWPVKIASMGYLSKMNMVKSIIRDIQKK